ncbi:HSF-type DNA-binding protein [Achlya hypogyna]|uniref:HSF-type DNA-binding protein n=1 Tax=Achlya hypogyna TaxID=1202772 RepID=A0A1V9YUU1_ACHHY|nr:HSF-type DNA-binding protein [Achlya hypogyna]
MAKILMPADAKTSPSDASSDGPPEHLSPLPKFKTEIPKFLLQLFDILEEEESSVIKWADDGASLQILDPGRATREILPKYFSHNNFQSFQRQLNYFGFRKWTKTKTYICTFSHPFFKKNEPDLLQFIKRKSVPKRTRSIVVPQTELLPAAKEPIYFKRKLHHHDGNCPIRPYVAPDVPATEPKILPADVIVFSNQALPNLSTIRTRLIMRQETAKPDDPPADDSEDPVNLLLGIKQAMVEARPSEEVPPQPSPEAKPDDVHAQLAAARAEIAALRASLEAQVSENNRLRAEKPSPPPARRKRARQS